MASELNTDIIAPETGSEVTITELASSSVNITGGTVTGITDLVVADGGTGASSLTDGGVLLGSGTGAITPMAVLADGEIIIGDGTTDPVALAAFSSSTGTLKVANGGTGVATLADGGLLVGNVTAAIDVVAAGATTDILVGGGAATAPVWTAATGSGSPVRATSPSLTTPLLGTPTSGVLTNCTNKLILGTEQATTSGTTIDFTGIPAGVKQVVVSLDSVSTDGTGGLELTLGTAGGFVVTGYVSRTIPIIATAVSGADIVITDAFSLGGRGAAADTHIGSLVLTLKDATNHDWAMHGVTTRTNTIAVIPLTGHCALAAELTQIRLQNASGDTFDLGSINIAYIS